MRVLCAIPMCTFCLAFADSYWTVLGLVHSNMTKTAIGVVENLLHLLDLFGFVPNGGRIYYALPGRSQPPLLSSMVEEIYLATNNVTILAESYNSLLREYSFWMEQGPYGHAVSISANGQSYSLNRYVTDQVTPRPESYAEDLHTAAAAGFNATDPGALLLFSQIAAAAESGWDFSARWFADYSSISLCDTVSNQLQPYLLSCQYMHGSI
jgi:alpha,alpha-trehalase